MAAQLSSLSVRQILRHMDERLKLLTGGRGGTVERQWATLREAIRFSYERLALEPRLLFRRLAVFSRGCTWDAATAICRSANQDKFVVHELLKELDAGSLLAIEEGREGKRFRMLDSIRQFAAGELEASGERTEIDERHAAWFVSLVERVAPELLKQDQACWLDLLTEDADNLRGAILWSVRTGRTEKALRLVSGLWRLTEIRGYLREGRERLEQALAMPGTEAYPALRSKALSGLGMLAYRQGDMPTARRHFEASLDIERTRDDPVGLANALNDLGNVAQMQGDFEAAGQYYKESLALERQGNNERGVAVGLFNLGNCARRLGRLDEAEDLYGQSRRGFEAAGNRREAAFPLNGLGLVALKRGRYDEAMSYAEEGLAIRRELSDKIGVADSQRTLGIVRLKRGNVPEALELLSKSLELARSVEDNRGIAETVEQFASAAGTQREFETATTLYAAAQQIRDLTHVQLAPLERSEREAELDAARMALGQARFEKSQAEGRAMSRAALIERTATVPAHIRSET
jgi:tetratricopeptide (TPR) repeat protein